MKRNKKRRSSGHPIAHIKEARDTSMAGNFGSQSSKTPMKSRNTKCGKRSILQMNDMPVSHEHYYIYDCKCNHPFQFPYGSYGPFSYPVPLPPFYPYPYPGMYPPSGQGFNNLQKNMHPDQASEDNEDSLSECE